MTLRDTQCQPELRLPAADFPNKDRLMIAYAELEAFFSDLVTTAQSRGITCAITSGMACVHFGVAATTKDCDLLCDADKADEFRVMIDNTELRGLRPQYRGFITPPLDGRWLHGGWTSHVRWKTRPEETCLDVFGVAPRGSSAWEKQLAGIYALPNVVAEMKRTNREKDWPYATALGGLMLEAGEMNGWLHLHDLETLRAFTSQYTIPAQVSAMRPLLRLAPFDDTLRMKRLLMAERAFWGELDEIRIHIYQEFLRPYTSAVRRQSKGRRDMSLAESHEIRLRCAIEHLPQTPLRDFGLKNMVLEAQGNVSSTIGPDVAEWLPAAENNFFGL